MATAACPLGAPPAGPLPPLGQDLAEENPEPAEDVAEPRPPSPQSAYCLPDWEDMNLDSQEPSPIPTRTPVTDAPPLAFTIPDSPPAETIYSSPEMDTIHSSPAMDTFHSSPNSIAPSPFRSSATTGSLFSMSPLSS